MGSSSRRRGLHHLVARRDPAAGLGRQPTHPAVGHGTKPGLVAELHERNGPMKQVLLFSLTAMANPTLVAATTVMLLLPHPEKLMLGYLLGALLTSITLGLVIVFALENSSALSTAKQDRQPGA